MQEQAPITISRCDATHADEWDRFIAATPGGSFYHRFGWRAVNQRAFGHECHYLAARRGERLIGVLPLVAVRSRMFGKILCSMPFVNYGGPVSAEPEAEDALLEAASRLVREQRLDYLELRMLQRTRLELPCAEHKVSLSLELQSDPEVLWSAFKSKHRTNIRRVYKDGFSVRHGGAELLVPFYRVLCESWRSLGTPLYRLEYFRHIFDQLGDDVRLFLVEHEGEPVAAAFNGHFGDTVEGMWLGVRPQYRAAQPSYVLYWEMIRHACESGMRHYHLGRSSAGSEAETFKRKWNAEPRQLYWQYYLPHERALPALNPGNPRFGLAIETWKRLPLGLTRLLGPPLARAIP